MIDDLDRPWYSASRMSMIASKETRMKLSSLIVLLVLMISGHTKAELVDVTNKINQMRCSLDDEGDSSNFTLNWYPGSPKPNLHASWQCGMLRDCSNTFAIDSITYETDRMVYTAKLADDRGFAVIYMNLRRGVYNRPTGDFLLSGKIRRSGYNCTIK
jgi:hypothetical protein